jgi:hypothetical protein
MTPNLTGQVPGQKPVRRLNNRYQPNAQSAVLVKKDGVEYAIVSDDNYAHLDPYWRAMYDSWKPYYYSPTAPFITKKVAVGGKLGIIKDPFGTAEYLGATLPYDGYGIVNLSLSEDGKVLLGQFKGGYSGNLFSPYAGMPLPSTNAAWNVDNLLDAALAQPAEDRLSKHINLPPDTLLSVPTHPGQPIGTYFDDALPAISVEGRMGDIIEVDLKRLVAQSLGMQDLLITNGLKDFELDEADVFAYADDYTAADGIDAITPFTLVTVAGEQNHDLYSRNGAQTADFATTGRMYLAPKLTTQDIVLPNGERISADIKKLRNGERLADKQATLNFSFKMKDGNGDWITKHTSVTVTAKDIAQLNTFFGDRPLDNPGYSEFELSGRVAVNSINDVLDVYRVEQRLAYLGFPAMGTGSPSPDINPNDRNNAIQDFTVDGQFGNEEAAALKLFEKVVRYNSNDVNSRTFNNTANGADGKLGASETLTLTWLNAYNAPHWMQFFADTGADRPRYETSNDAKLPGWENTQVGTKNRLTGRIQNVEVYGTSWMFDLMAAKQSALNEYAWGLQSPSWFNGSVDANLGVTPLMHSTHSLGMAFDLGVTNYIDNSPDGAQSNADEVLDETINALQNVSWSVDSAYNYSENLTNSTDPRNNQRSALRDFLSLYAVTHSDTIDGNGTWDDLPVTNGEAVRAALFGGGEVLGGLISQVLIGGVATYTNSAGRIVHENPYPNINAILDKLGINASPSKGHQNHFHIYLKPPAPVGIDGANHLVTDVQSDSTTVTTVPDTAAQSDIQGLLDYAQTLFDSGEELMFTMDVPYVPYVPAQETPIVLAQANVSDGSISHQPDFILETCKETRSVGDLTTAMNVVDPAGWLAGYLGNQRHRDLYTTASASIKPILLESTNHGKLIPKTTGSGVAYFMYEPESGYEGQDRAVFMAEFEGKRYKIIVVIEVSQYVDESASVCPESQLIKVNKPEKGSSLIDLNTINFAALEGGAVGQSDLTGITLDDNANGYAWYIDLTPGLNEEFLPTSNPYEWVAKPGSDAEGKMDFLTVLLHEAAHSLGLDHTADAHALMASTLQPGVRRLPSPELLAELQQRSNDESLITLTPTLSHGERENPVPAPLPLGIGFTAFWAGRMRKSGFGYVFESSPDGVQRNPGDDSPHYAPLHAGYGVNGVRYEVAPNPTLLNTDFAGNTGWNTTGTVTFGSNAAVLTESPVAQTRLNQLFTLGDNDRFLRFTLDNVNASPDDVIEVALINTNTGSVIRD